MDCKKKLFGVYKNQSVYSFVFTNNNGFSVECISYGATLKALYFPRRQSASENKSVVLGYDNLDDYLKDVYFLGSCIGRTAGRIGKASFELNGKIYNIDKNDGDNNLHGGKNGFHSLIWNGQIINGEKTGVKFFKAVKSDDDAFPGNMSLEITYLLNNDNELEIVFKGTSDKATLFNPTNHAYFNLNSNQDDGILNHYLMLNADKYLKTDETLIPTGDKIDVKMSAYDFTKERLIDDSLKILTKNYSIKGAGLDTPFCLNSSVAAVLKNADKSRCITIVTDRNAMVVYTSNYFDSKQTINDIYSKPYMAIALEAQILPDAIHHKNFGNTAVMESETKEYKTIIQMRQY
ncbi:MAG: galactose mutarotase [Endomicrobium sp.]|nr:galactose mutarotase [Endomicrobium sp.]